jgi:hypothetical protein
MVKNFLNFAGFFLLTIGVVWFLQGINILPGSFMTGQIQWAYNGGAAAIVGIVILVLANRLMKS